MITSDVGQHPRTVWANVLVFGAIGALVAVRRQHTLWVCLALFALAVFATVTVTPVSSLSTAIFVVAFMTYTAGHELDFDQALIALLAVVVTVFAVDALEANHVSVGDGFFPSAVFAIAWGVGRALRGHLMLTRELAITNQQLEIEREERARDAVADERRRDRPRAARRRRPQRVGDGRPVGRRAAHVEPRPRAGGAGTGRRPRRAGARRSSSCGGCSA